ncbi:MAG: ribosomal protein L7/L12 [Cyanobacteria bacterium SZAS LIN-2]|nr:ribosomal protein L7/L12 [Cyanobacteria bacterium SZAS LIN-3]MBS1996044.1 ribosomal protein L7/L12 [Cyanobacteria bacterium SZAS LIN-2]MBS2006575.1 ribosomal protein L7/L12 [Cyanobacteria bacterium SZAS TMP-1]
MRELGLTLPDDPGIGPAQKSLSPEILALLPDNKIEAIKLHRMQTGLGLKESKDIIDAAWREMHP